MKRELKKQIHVNRQVIAQNAKDGGKRATLTCKTGKKNHRGAHVLIDGPSEMIDATLCGRKPLSCGARVWIETRAPVWVDGVRV